MSNLQLELLKLYATDIPEQQLRDIKQLLAAYVALFIPAKRIPEDIT